MSNLIRTIFSALRRWEDSKQRAPESGTESDLRYVALPRHRISLTATASFGFSGIPEEIRIRDINEKGLYFYTNLDMPIGATLDIVAVLPPEISADGKGRRVHYEAKVARVEREQGKVQYGVGASIRRCESFPLPTTTSPKKPAIPAPDRAPAPAPQTVQPTEAVQENVQSPTKTLAPLQIPKTAEPSIPKTTTPLRIPKIAEPVKGTPASAPSQKIAAPIEETTAPVEKTVAPVVQIRASAVIDDTAAPNRPVTNQNRRAVEKLATAGLRAGLSLEELVRLIDSGVTPTELVDIIEARLTAHIE
jgi:hypothetical protein